MLKVTVGAAKDTELYAGTPTWNTNAIGDQVVTTSNITYNSFCEIPILKLSWNEPKIVKYLQFLYYYYYYY